MNMKNKTKILALALIVLLGGVSFAENALAGFGVSPPQIKEDRLVKGSKVERTVYLVQGSPVDNLDVEVTVDDSQISEWISFYPGKTFTIPAGTQQFPLEVMIDVPDDAPLGIYKTSVRVSQTESKDEVAEGGAGVSIIVGIVVNIEIKVGEGLFYSFAIKDIDLKDVNSSEFPKASLRIENLGNIPAGPQNAEFQLFNKYDDRRLAVIQGVEINQVPAFETQTIDIDFPIGVALAPGEYWGHVFLYDNNELVKEYSDVFNVTEATFVDKYSRLILIGSIVIVVLIVVIFLISFFYHRLKRKHNKLTSGQSTRSK